MENENQPDEGSNEDQEISLNWTSETSTKQKPEKIKKDNDEEPEIEDNIEETSFQQSQPIPRTFQEEPEPIQDQPIQNLETDLQNALSEQTQGQISYDSNAGAYDRAPSLISAPVFEQRVQGIQQPTRFETPSSWEHARTQNTAWERPNINETVHMSQTIDEKKYDFSEDFAKRRRRG